MSYLGKEELPAEIVETFDKAWEIARPECEGYVRGFDDIPGKYINFSLQF